GVGRPRGDRPRFRPRRARWTCTREAGETTPAAASGRACSTGVVCTGIGGGDGRIRQSGEASAPGVSARGEVRVDESRRGWRGGRGLTAPLAPRREALPRGAAELSVRTGRFGCGDRPSGRRGAPAAGAAGSVWSGG